MAAIEATPATPFTMIYNHLTEDRIHLAQGKDRFWRLTLPKGYVKVIRPHDALRFTHIGSDPRKRVYDLYTRESFEPQTGETVVDVGAYLGEFSWWVQQHRDPGELVLVEPDCRSCLCLSHNVPRERRIEWAAAGSHNTETTINLADDPSESGILSPDSGGSTQVTVEQRRLDSIVDDVDYLKVEAEGYEPEVLTGMGGLRPGKVVVNVSPERDGESPAEECASILRKKGYDTDRDGDTLFARLP